MNKEINQKVDLKMKKKFCKMEFSKILIIFCDLKMKKREVDELPEFVSAKNTKESSHENGI